MANTQALSLAILFLVFNIHSITAELFTALIHLQQLLPTDRSVAEAVGHYHSAETTRIERLQSSLAELTLLESLNITDSSDALLRYLLISRLSWSWVRTIEITCEESRASVEEVHIGHRLPIPTEEDLDGAAVGLCRLTETYRMTVQAMAGLRTPGMIQPSANDINEVAERCFAADDYSNAAMWWEYAIAVLGTEEDPTEDREDMAEGLTYTLSRLGKLSAAMKVATDQLQLTPGNKYLLKKRAKYARQLREGTVQTPVPSKESDADMFRDLCVDVLPMRPTRLSCKFTTNGGQPWLLLEPLKMEVVSEDPRIVVFHDFIGSRECETLRRLAMPQLARATVFHGDQMTTSSYRIGKVAWLTECFHPLVARLSRRIVAATGLSLISAELLQIVNYGVGGHYVPHFDFRAKNQPDTYRNKVDGDRLATWLMYLSDVTAGGATVFTWPQVAVRPKEGKVVFWFNLVPDSSRASDTGPWGEVRKEDVRMLHGACPVLHGSKWIATKWIHERGQRMVFYDRPN